MPDVQPDDRLAVAAVCTRIMPGTPRGEIAVGFERARSAGAAYDETATTTTRKRRSMLTIEAYQQKIDDWVRTHGVRYFSELTNTAILMEEVGEVARIMARAYGDQSFKQTTARPDLADELADVLFVVGCIANQTGIDLTAAVERNLAKKTERDAERHWNNPKLTGTNQHPDDQDS